MATSASTVERRVIDIHGVVQGVGFRPFVYGLAQRLDLKGFVKNRTGGVLIEVEGNVASLDRFVAELTGRPPPLARIDGVCWERDAIRGEERFCIENSDTDSVAEIFVSADAATCDACLDELFDPLDRRFLYPFLNCTNCGPRLTIVTGAPYDRERTTMAGFCMCAACRAEYDNPRDRRFHAQPTACAACGPNLALRGADGKECASISPLADFAAALRHGKIGAVKGLGGYHLACDACNHAAVAELRRRKHRDEKPFALMVRDPEAARAICRINTAEEELLVAPARPIVLLRKRPNIDIADATAPGNPYLGVMLPYTPLHHLLLRELDGMPLVMTSGNRSDEPIAYEDDDACRRLAGIADLYLVHNRPIHVRCDDSVTRIVAGVELPLRRSRGYAPQPLTLPFACPEPTLAVGGQLKATFALGRGRHALLSHHLGDLDHLEAYRAFTRDVQLYQSLFRIHPIRLAHDLHADYGSSRYAQERARACTTPVQLCAVQHHHAHMASCMAENGLTGPVIGVSFDGTGLGTDGCIWGGEFLVGDYRDFHRAAHLRYVGMPGGDQAIREPWRMALAHLIDAKEYGGRFRSRLSAVACRTVERMLERRFQTPLTSSAGRLFDAVAALAGGRDCVHHEGQAAMELEWLATGTAPDGHYPFDVTARPTDGKPPLLEIDTRPLIRAVSEDAAKGVEAPRIARRFHSAMVETIAAVCARLRQATGIATVTLSGGVFMNALLTCEASARLKIDGFDVYRHRRVPPNDGGLSLGQLAVAAARAAS